MMSIVEKAFLERERVKLYYKNSESAIVALLAMRDSKGPITSSALKTMMKQFEATGFLALQWTQLKCRFCCHDSGADSTIQVGGCCTWGV
ncbi:hypothetical protein TNCV_2885931 [Trichonephila clavipes]|nr:hypothetical protein TNCV_2885931 [Trichonephila clavipes]